MSQHNVDSGALAQLLERGHRFYAKKNFHLAKQAFEAALQMQPNQELLEKIQICSAAIAAHERKETIKRGRKLEKKGKHAAALQYFEKARSEEPESWLETKIAELRDKLAHSTASSLVAGVDESDDLETRLAAYDKALAVKPSRGLWEKKGECLLQLGRIEEAMEVYAWHSPCSDRGRYCFGYACARSGQYRRALEQWTGIEVKTRSLLEQAKALVPFVGREVDAEAFGYAVPYTFFNAVADTTLFDDLRDCARYFRYRYIEELWAQEEYRAILEVLSSHPETMSLPLLELYAKLYFKLAERDIGYLEPLISFWLTAVHNDRLLGALHATQMMGEDANLGLIREKLVQCLADLIDRFEREGLMVDRLRALWETEARIIQQMRELSVPTGALEIFPCTPAFAARFSLCEQIFSVLEARRKASGDDTEQSLEASAFFSAAGPALMLSTLGEDNSALACVPRDTEDEVGAYCRQRVFLGLGMKKARQGEKQIKKLFVEALPLLKKHSRYVDEIIEFAYSGESVDSYVGLADVMEYLSVHLETSRFREATAHAMGIKAVELLNSGVNKNIVKKLLGNALEIYPQSELAQSTLAELRNRMEFDELSKAFQRQNLSKAVQIINRSRNPTQIQYFFETMEAWYESTRHWDHSERLTALWEFYQSCRLVDPDHPLTLELAGELEPLEKA